MASSSPNGQNKAVVGSAQLIDLNKPEKLSRILKKDADHCFSCKMTGAAVMFGLAGYIFFSGRRSLLSRKPEIIKMTGSPKTLGVRMMGLGTLSGAFVAMGIYRLIN